MLSTSSGFLDPAGPLTGSNDTVFWIFAGATFVMVAASVIIAIREAVTLRSHLPILLLVSATIWLPNEPFIDQILGFQYADDAPAELFTLAGRVIPVSALGIGAMFSLFTWFIHRMIVNGRSYRDIVVVAVVAGVIDWPLEIMAIQADVFHYYGDNPTRIFGLPLTSAVQNCFLYVFMASIFTLAAPYLRGWRSLLFLPVIPGCYYAVALLCTWPAYLALHAEWPTAVFLPLGLIAAAMNALIPLAMLRFTFDHRAATTATTDTE
ncbi:hypothetical protein [Paraconexibacter algicola]|uniref:hypothetical protein n=1 Tax=Paraconexibacter algicola TaxID=2133960 RepID=UPI001304F1CC|nr:hypothetical protein [Paraconexibacter algicola]